MEKYEFLRNIGVGSFGLAKLMRDMETKELVTAKFIERGPKVLLTPTHLLIVMEYASGGQLYDRVINAGRFAEDGVQGFKFDPEGEYVRQWLPELARMPSSIKKQTTCSRTSFSVPQSCSLSSDLKQPCNVEIDTEDSSRNRYVVSNYFLL